MRDPERVRFFFIRFAVEDIDVAAIGLPTRTVTEHNEQVSSVGSRSFFLATHTAQTGCPY